MIEDVFSSLIFPAAVAVYLLYERKIMMDRFLISIEENTHAVHALTDMVKELSE